MAYDDVLGGVSLLKKGISRVESGGNYEALGPEIKRKSGIDRAYGKYQVMGSNIPQWTQEALGQSMTPFEFLRSPGAQEKVFENQMARNLQKYGTLQDAASVWFSGMPLSQAQRAGAHDINLGVSDYVNKALGEAQGPVGPQYAEGPKKTATDILDRHVENFMARKRQEELDRHVDDWMTKKFEPEVKPAPLQPIATPTTNAPQEAPSWNFPMEAANAAGFGYLPEAMSFVTGREPAEYEKARADYENRYGVNAAAANLVGGVVQGIPLAMTGAGILGAVAPKVAVALPKLAPVANWAERVFSGTAGRTGAFPSGGTLSTPGMAARVESATAPIVAGAAAGGGNALLNQKLRPDVPVWEQVKEGTKMGAAMGPLGHMAFGRPGPTFSPEIEEHTRALTQEARARGIPITPWQVTSEPIGGHTRQVAGNTLSHADWRNQAVQFGQAFGKTFGLRGEFTEKNVEDAIEDISRKLENVANSINLRPLNDGTGRLVNDLTNLAHEVNNDVLDDALKTHLFKTIQHLGSTILGSPVTGKQLQGLTQKNGFIDKNFPAQTNSVNKYYNKALKGIVFDFLKSADSANAASWAQARNEYKNALLGLKMVTPSGVPNAAKLPAAAERVGAKGEAAKLAEIASLVPKVVNAGTGTIAEIPPSHPGYPWLPFGIGASGAALAHVGGMEELMGNVLGYSQHNLPTGPLLIGLGAGIGAKALPAIYRMGKRQVLSGNVLQDAILSGKMPEYINQGVVNPLATGIVSADLGIKERSARRKK